MMPYIYNGARKRGLRANCPCENFSCERARVNGTEGDFSTFESVERDYVYRMHPSFSVIASRDHAIRPGQEEGGKEEGGC